MEKNVLNTDLTGKVAVVTGASGTLCSIFAKALARAGAKVALLGRNMDKLKELADEIEAEGGTAKGYDLQRDEQGQLSAGSRGCAGRLWPLRYPCERCRRQQRPRQHGQGIF